MPDWEINAEDIERELDRLEENNEDGRFDELLDGAPERDEDGNLIDYDPKQRPRE